MSTSVFRKENTSGYADALKQEARGLACLKNACDETRADIRIPTVLSVDEKAIELTRIHVQPATDELMSRLGDSLAHMHGKHAQAFGLDDDNYIGLNPQVNTPNESWGDFFVHQRIQQQILWIENKAIQTEFNDWLMQIQQPLKYFLDQHNDGPSLLHGDLWSGNALFDEDDAWLIDPAVYFGDREVDIAMTEMFGGFSEAFYAGYRQVWPLSHDYNLKKRIYNLYHFFNHYNLFGSSYLGSCRRLCQEITQELV